MKFPKVTEYSSAEKRTSVSSSELSTDHHQVTSFVRNVSSNIILLQYFVIKEKRDTTPKTSWRSKVSASDEGR